MLTDFQKMFVVVVFPECLQFWAALIKSFRNNLVVNRFTKDDLLHISVHQILLSFLELLGFLEHFVHYFFSLPSCNLFHNKP